MTKFQTAETKLDAAARGLRIARELFERRHSAKNRQTFETAGDAYEDALAAFAVVRDAPGRVVMCAPAIPPARQGDLFA